MSMALFALLASAAVAPQSSAQSQPQPPIVYRRAPVVEPAKLALARSVAAKLLPTGTYRSIVDQPVSMTTLSLVHQILMMPVADLVRDLGLPALRESVDGPPVKQVQLLNIVDPAHTQRGEAIYKVAIVQLSETADQYEPIVREALATAYGTSMTQDQLGELDRFLASPAGAAYAKVAASLDANLDVIGAKQQLAQAMVRAAPAIAEQARRGTTLSPPKKAAELTADERDKVAAILGMDPAELKKAKTQ